VLSVWASAGTAGTLNATAKALHTAIRDFILASLEVPSPRSLHKRYAIALAAGSLMP
jgi:hypothetical protein